MLISIAQAQFFFLALTRIMAILIHVPVLGGQLIPTQVRIALGLLLAAILIPWQPIPASAKAIELIPFAVAIVREIALGTLVGFAADLTFGALQIAAELMGLSSGFAAAKVFNPALGDSGSAYDQLFLMVTFLVFLVTNGHHGVLLAIQKTFIAIPLNSSLPAVAEDHLLLMTSQLITAGIQLALPVMTAMLLTDLVLALLARVAPQVQVFFLGMPIKIGVSLFLLALLFKVIGAPLTSLFQSIGPRMLVLVGR